MTSATPSPSFELSIDSDNVECRQSAPQAGGSSRSGGASLAVGDLQSDRILIQSGTRKTPLVENGHSLFSRESTSVNFLQRRQKSACSTKCATSSQCSTSSTPPPTTDDCNYLISSMWTVANDTKVLEPYNYITLTYKSCLMKVENTTPEKLTFCYSTWADQSALLMNCLPGAPGGTCSADGVKLTVDHTPTERPVVPETSTTSSSSTLPPPSPNENSPRTTTTTTSTINIGTTTTTTTTTTATATTAASTSTARGDSISTFTGTSAPLLHISQTIGTGTSVGTPSTFSAPGPESASPNQENHRGRTILVIIGVVAGVVTLLFLVSLWIWRRKRRARKGNRAREKMEERAEPFVIPSHNSMSSTHNLIMTHKAIRPTTDAIVDLGQWDRKDFTNLSNTFDLRLVIPASTTPGEVGDRRSSASSRASNASTQQHRHFEPQQQQQQQTRDPDITVITPNDAINDQNGLPPLVSVRRMTQRLAPNLSEQDLDRLAENIIARMQGTITTPPGHGRPNSGESVLGHLEEGVAASSGEEDPPPPWRESWNSSRRGELLER